jgi:hypothetical protein
MARSRLSPVQRTLRALRDRGLLVGIVERFNQYAGPFGRREDLFGFLDLIAVDVDSVIGVQVCGADFAEHDRKIREECREDALAWIRVARLELWSWRKVKLRRGGKAMVWAPRVKRYTEADFEQPGNRE